MGAGGEDREQAYRELLSLHEDVENRARELVDRLPFELECRRGCNPCCIDGLSVFGIEAERIVRNHGALLAGGEAGPEGGCAFLDTGGSCRIYEDRPYVCRTQGLPIRWFTRDEAGETVEMRDICPLNDPGELLEILEEESCWQIGPMESRLAALQERWEPGGEDRISLRSLFRRA